uniref:Uncharacterized protein n=1 Tax=Fagus sylvatica TaxID=28930 RepID=A0A2N9IRV2_FAGSY
MSEVHAGLIDLASSSGIKPKAAHELMSREAGGRANLGYTDRDQQNYLRTRRQRNLMYREAGCLLRKLVVHPTYNTITTDSHEEHDSHQIYQICPLAPMMSYEFERGGSCDIGFTSFFKGPFVSTTLPSSSSQVSNNANIDQGGEVGLNYTLTPGVENTNAYLQT